MGEDLYVAGGEVRDVGYGSAKNRFKMRIMTGVLKSQLGG